MKHHICESHAIVLEFIMVEKVSVLWLGKLFSMQVLDVAINYAFVRLALERSVEWVCWRM